MFGTLQQVKLISLMGAMMSGISLFDNAPTGKQFSTEKTKMKCGLPGCDKTTSHNGGYCCADHCKQHRMRKKIKRDDEHCGDCPYLKPYGKEYDLTARCSLLGKDLMWHDYWIAECEEDKKCY